MGTFRVAVPGVGTVVVRDGAPFPDIDWEQADALHALGDTRPDEREKAIRLVLGEVKAGRASAATAKEAWQRYLRDDRKHLVANEDPAVAALAVRISQKVRTDLHRNAAWDPKCPAEVLKDLANSRSDISKYVAENPNTPRSAYPVLVNKAIPVAEALAKRADCPPELLERLAARNVDSISKLVAAHTSTPTDVLRAMASHQPLHAPLAGNPNLPPDLFQVVIRYDHNAHLPAAKNPNCTPGALDTLATLTNLVLLVAVAEHPNLADDTRRRLLNHPVPLIRHTVASRPDTPQ